MELVLNLVRLIFTGFLLCNIFIFATKPEKALQHGDGKGIQDGDDIHVSIEVADNGTDTGHGDLGTSLTGEPVTVDDCSWIETQEGYGALGSSLHVYEHHQLSTRNNITTEFDSIDKHIEEESSFNNCHGELGTSLAGNNLSLTILSPVKNSNFCNADCSEDEMETSTCSFSIVDKSKYRTSTPRKGTNVLCDFQLDSSGTLSVYNNDDGDVFLNEDMSFELMDEGQNDDKSLQSRKSLDMCSRSGSSILRKAMASILDCKKKGKVCRKNCIEGLNEQCIQNMRYRLWTKNYQQRVEWFSDKYMEADVQKNKINFFVGKGLKVCGKCFQALYFLNKNFYYKWIPKFEEGAVSSGYRNGRATSKYLDDAMVWLDEYGKFRGDLMPDKQIILLPYKTIKFDVFKLYEEEMAKDWKVSIGKSKFYSMWMKSFGHLKIKKTNSFSRCQTCTTLSKRLEATRDQMERGQIKTLVRVHNNRQMRERAYYRSKRNQAEENKRHFLSIIIDGMDQSKTNLPHFTGRKSKALDQANLLSTHVQGIINHGLKRFTTFVDVNEYAHDPNMVMNTILRELYDTSVLMNNFLPEVLYLQADNCFRENKNRYILAFAEYLVRKDIFREVHLSFLMVGHTHEDIDAEFSKIAERLRKSEAETMVQLMNILPISKHTNGLYDIKKWLNVHITPITGQSGPLHFKFSRNENNEVIGEYKGLCHRPWIKMPHSVLKKLPVGIPQVLVPNFKKHNFDLLEKNIEKCKYLFSDIVTNTQYRWWQRYIAFLRQTCSSQTKTLQYAKKNARWLMPLLPKQRNGREPVIQNLPREITEMVDKEIDDPVIKMKSPRKFKKTVANTKKRSTTGKKTGTNRTIYTTFVYGDMYQKRQIYFSAIAELVELLLFLHYILHYVTFKHVVYSSLCHSNQFKLCG